MEIHKNCEQCGKTCMPLPVKSKPECSEFFCWDCWKSYRMHPDVAKMYTAQPSA